MFQPLFASPPLDNAANGPPIPHGRTMGGRVKLNGYEGKYALACRRADGEATGPEEASDDEAALRLRARRLIATGDYAGIELRVWNFELNDWVRIETFEPG